MDNGIFTLAQPRRALGTLLLPVAGDAQKDEGRHHHRSPQQKIAEELAEGVKTQIPDVQEELPDAVEDVERRPAEGVNYLIVFL
jgi:hypothetical protein